MTTAATTNATTSSATAESAVATGGPGPRRIAVTGAGGFIGAALVPSLAAGGNSVRRIGRGAGSDARWDPVAGALDAQALDGIDAVIHLAGENIAQRWTPKAKRAIRESRVTGTRLISEACARASPRIEVLVCASAIGVYGSRGDEWLDERSTLGDDFLAEVCRAWESAAAPARDAGIRVVHLRFGIVLNPSGGALAKLLLPFQLGLGGRIGDGRQWMSWISRTDLVRALQFVLVSTGIVGPVNATAPEPATNATFTSTLGRILHRPTIAPVPAVALRILLGEMAAGTVLASQRVRPTVLESTEFTFRHPTLVSALRFELGRP